ncbi:ATP-binding protein [Spirilliplanes yamanashiensis]|uniref:STAS domain-containing protein n=1 Tax=Spirilliplanes yamanashiensis TaxID=42233 RepID=A0A8J3Y6M9_9ACTN|nr:ATP-binding protein [Spirilliplanes yamanashiensis]MDP9817506.1 anti-anti-sigma regulatory factor [Spirilliplanes yamanashiensis]GIJ02841.1 hypothetical protein Sya03_21930 [Spirilliplanes yamanashiensis]
MSGSLSFSAEDDDAGCRVLTATGTLDRKSAPKLRLTLLKALAEQPAAVLVDLARVRLTDPLALTVFTAVGRQAAMWPGIPVALCAPAPVLAAALSRGIHRRLPVHPSVVAARADIARRHVPPQTVSDELLPVAGAARHARDLVTDACVRWEIPHLVFPASLAVSELVSNAVQHARTMVTLRLSLRPRHLLVAVQDGSPDEPVIRPTPGPSADGRDGGRGLPLVAALALHWGSLPTAGGKVVWASFPLGDPAGDA